MSKNRVVKLDLSVRGVQKAISEVVRYHQWLRDCSNKLMSRLMLEGYQIASARFETSQYDGTNDVTVSIRSDGPNVRAIVAVGAATLFIEFGTGVTYPDDYPGKKPAGVSARGTYGKGHGSRPVWGYYGEPGTNGQVRDKIKDGMPLVTTRGNPANACMYQTVRDLERMLPVMVKEVFV